MRVYLSLPLLDQVVWWQNTKNKVRKLQNRKVKESQRKSTEVEKKERKLKREVFGTYPRLLGF